MDEKVLKQLADGLKNKNPEAVKAYKNLQKIAQGQGEEAEKAKGILNKIQTYLTKKALHGTKLNYFKSLKNQCAEDEEVVYYKQGGSVGCGCKKKEDGGQVNKASIGGIVERFKNRAKQKFEEAKKLADKKEADKAFKEHRMIPGKHLPRGNDNVTEAERKDVTRDLKGSKIKKNCGGAVAKFKMHRQGGSLNNILFMQGGNRVAPKAEVRYANSKKYTNGDGIVDANINYQNPTRVVYQDAPYLKYVPASISEVIAAPGDTIYTETPEVQRFARFGLFRPIPRKRSASTLHPNGQEYEILKRRFNTAWNLAK